MSGKMLKSISNAVSETLSMVRQPAFIISVITLIALLLVFLHSQYMFYAHMSEGKSVVEEAKKLSQVYLGAFVITIVLLIFVMRWSKLLEKQ